jgi:hypothetical protein
VTVGITRCLVADPSGARSEQGPIRAWPTPSAGRSECVPIGVCAEAEAGDEAGGPCRAGSGPDGGPTASGRPPRSAVQLLVSQ